MSEQIKAELAGQSGSEAWDWGDNLETFRLVQNTPSGDRTGPVVRIVPSLSGRPIKKLFPHPPKNMFLNLPRTEKVEFVFFIEKQRLIIPSLCGLKKSVPAE